MFVRKISFCRWLVLWACWQMAFPVVAAEAEADSSSLSTMFNSSIFTPHPSDSLVRERHKKTFFHRVGDVFTKFFREFNNTDPEYIEPQHYNYSVMLQNTNTYEVYKLANKDGQSITFSPDITYRLGPYAGWRWVFLGYTVDVKNFFFHTGNTSKKEFNISLYSSMLGLDLFWRETGNDYRIKKLSLGNNIDTSPINGADFDGVEASIKGFNLYYIFNHRKFSYPAAYAQSTVQRKSAGSLLVGIGFTRHKLEINWEKLEDLAVEKLSDRIEGGIDKRLKAGTIEYSDISGSCGYAYNWVFAKNFLFNASLSMALAYNQSFSDVETSDSRNARVFSFKNFNLDGIGRFALVWNNTLWYAGSSLVVHTYNYSKDRFYTNNSFGALNLYIGVNLGRK